MNNLIIRHAAGVYWLIKPVQKSKYVQPLVINESAAEIVEYIQDGKNVYDIAVMLSEGDQSIVSEIEQDILNLINEINRHFGFPAS